MRWRRWSSRHDDSGLTLSDIGERRLIEKFGAMLPALEGVVAGIGDDCAVVRNPTDTAYDYILTSDPIIGGVHFESDTPAAMIGRKAIARMLSDIAAMGGEPLWALLDFVAPATLEVWKAEAILSAIAETARRYGLNVIGGDTAEGPGLQLHVFGIGRVPRGTAVLRSGARPGDVICVTGSLGGSFRSNRHLRFEPRLVEGAWLREHGFATAMLDISDGLASDLRRLMEMSGTGACIREDAIPCSPESLEQGDRTPFDAALHDGEDYELLFTVPEDRVQVLKTSWSAELDVALSTIGGITAQRGVLEYVALGGERKTIVDSGYEHFKKAGND